MRAVIQRVKNASVTVEREIKSSIGTGLLVLLGIEDADVEEDVAWLSAKIFSLRVFDDKDGKMNLSVKDVNGDVLVISQFTLYAATKKGRRPSFVRAAKPETAIPLYEKFIKQMESDLGKPVFTGQFGAMMEISLVNDGPVTIFIDTKSKE